MPLTNTWKKSLPKSLVFIDSNLEEYQFLADGVHQNAEVVILNPARNGIEQINEAIQNFASQQGLIEAISIFSHGSPGSLQLGNSFLNSDNLESYGQILSSWKNALTNKANILLYGCRVAAGIGAEFIGKLREIIGVNIAASVNLTGSSKQGGNWDLEFTTGEILVPIALTEIAQENYPGVLATLTVTNRNDSGEGSLREAIATAEAGDTIVFAGSLANQTITLTSGQLEIDKDLIIDGGNASGLTISGNNAQRMIFVPDLGVETSVTIKNLTFVDGFTTEGGGAIQGERNTTLTIENSEFKNNVAGGGGAIMPGPETTTTIVNSKFDGNEAKPEQSSTLEIFDGGGAIKVFVLSNLIIQNSEFTNNKGTLGGAINSLGTNLSIENSAFVNNDSTAGRNFGDFGQGGAIYTDGASLNDDAATSGEVIIRDTVFDSNKAAGGGGAAFLFGYESDKYVIEGSTFVNNSTTDNGQGENGLGGGIRFGRNSELRIENTTFANNTSTHQAGGLWSDRDAITTIANSTFSGNKAERVSDDGSLNGFGGAMSLLGNATITNSTIANNSSGFVAGAIFSGDSPITVTNTIFDNNTAGNGLISQNTNRELTDGGGNIQFPDKLTTDDPNDNNATANITIADPLLGELQEINGALVRPLQAGSPAIDAGTNSGAPTTDQRGQERPIDGDGNGSEVTDIGAYEFVADTAPEPNNAPTIANNQTLTIDEGTADTITTDFLQVTDADGDPITFKIEELPDNGILELNNTNLTVNDTFSQTDIDNGNVSYSHNDSETTRDSFSLSASDGNGGNTGNIDVNVQVNAVNDRPSNINLSNNSIVENSRPGTVVATLSTLDADIDDTHTYTLVDDAEGRFSIDGDRLLVADGSKLDFESDSSHSITVQTTDSATFSLEQQLTLQIADVEENNQPIDLAIDNEEIAENSENGAEIGILSTTDPDTDDTHTYTLVEDAGGRFSIEGDRLLVADGSKLDFESNRRHNITVQTTDSGTPSKSLEKQLTIGVSDVEEVPPGLNLQGTENDDRLAGGANRDTLTGAGGSDTLIGGEDNDVLNGGLGSDVMRGGLGNDRYVADGSDEIIENADEGKDTVQVSATYRLPDNLERLVLVGSDDIDGTGNPIDNAIAGNDGNNKLVGAAGNDTIWGLGGRDTLIGSRGQDILFGGRGNDLLEGRLGRDRLNGNAGNDTLVGGVGIDTFIFNTNEEYRQEDLGSDIITDFDGSRGDRILLDRRTFTAITSAKGDGFSVDGEFEVVNSDAAAAVSDAVVVYNQANGNLFYNPNGSNNGLGGGGLFATLTDAPTLAESDFLVR